MDNDDVRRWVTGYEQAWRSAGTEQLADLFTETASYRMSPWRAPVEGLAAIRELWESERDGPDEEFTLRTAVLAVGEDTAVVRAEVDYDVAAGNRWRDLWVLEFAADGRCRAFEEWPFSPDQPDGH